MSTVQSVVITIMVLTVYILGIWVGTEMYGEYYTDCQEDEVWSWHMDYGADYPDDIEWECVVVDDLLSTHNP